MSPPTRVGLLAGVSSLALTGAGLANPTDAHNQDQRIAELEPENAALKVKVDTLQTELAEFKAPHVNGKPKETTIREEVSDEMSHTPHAMSSAI